MCGRSLSRKDVHYFFGGVDGGVDDGGALGG